jgi:hypothetical protein
MDIVDLFFAETKKQAEQVCDGLVLRQHDLRSLVELSRREFDSFPYHHAFKYREDIPKDLTLTEKNIAAITQAEVGVPSEGIRKTMRKLFQLPKDIERASAHLFYTPGHTFWHLFYFDIRDRGLSDPHWVGGAHIHYQSYLYTDRSCQEVWSNFCKDGKRGVGSGTHIRFQH